MILRPSAKVQQPERNQDTGTGRLRRRRERGRVGGRSELGRSSRVLGRASREGEVGGPGL